MFSITTEIKFLINIFCWILTFLPTIMCIYHFYKRKTYNEIKDTFLLPAIWLYTISYWWLNVCLVCGYCFSSGTNLEIFNYINCHPRKTFLFISSSISWILCKFFAKKEN